jgi:hypothetical protein
MPFLKKTRKNAILFDNLIGITEFFLFLVCIERLCSKHSILQVSRQNNREVYSKDDAAGQR